MNFSPPETFFFLISHLSACLHHTGYRTCCPSWTPGSQTRVEHLCWSHHHHFILYSLNILKSHQQEACSTLACLFWCTPNSHRLWSHPLLTAHRRNRDFPLPWCSQGSFSIHILKTLSLGLYFWTRFCSCPSEAAFALWVVCAPEISALEHGSGVHYRVGECITVTDMFKSPLAEERAEAEFCSFPQIWWMFRFLGDCGGHHHPQTHT